MVVNFKVCGISQGARKLVQTSTLIKKYKNISKKIIENFTCVFEQNMQANGEIIKDDLLCLHI
jgi:hypothetical protein